MKTELAPETENTTQALAEPSLEHSTDMPTGKAPDHRKSWAAFQKTAAIVVLLLAAWALMTGTSHASVLACSVIALYAIAFITLSLSRSSR